MQVNNLLEKYIYYKRFALKILVLRNYENNGKDSFIKTKLGDYICSINCYTYR